MGTAAWRDTNIQYGSANYIVTEFLRVSLVWHGNGQQGFRCLQTEHGSSHPFFIWSGCTNSHVMALCFRTCIIIAGKEVEKMRVTIIIYRSSEDSTTVVPMKESGIALENEYEKDMSSVL